MLLDPTMNSGGKAIISPALEKILSGSGTPTLPPRQPPKWRDERPERPEPKHAQIRQIFFSAFVFATGLSVDVAYVRGITDCMKPHYQMGEFYLTLPSERAFRFG